MKKKRINNDLNIRWELYDKNGNNLDLSNIAIDFKIIHATTRRAFIPIFSTENNIIISQFPAINQLKLGKYYLYCCLRNTDITVEGGIATYTFDSNDVFELVEKTALEDEFDEIAIYSNIEVTAGGNIGGGSLTEPQKQWIGEGKTLINGATSLPEGINMNTEELTKKAPINHNHDYAPSDHNHNELYAPCEHTHTDLLKKPDTDGTAGQVLTITEAGLQWKTPSSTGGGESIPGSGLTEEQKAFLGASGDLQTEAKDSLPKAINEVSNKVESLGQEVVHNWQALSLGDSIGLIENKPISKFTIEFYGTKSQIGSAKGGAGFQRTSTSGDAAFLRKGIGNSWNLHIQKGGKSFDSRENYINLTFPNDYHFHWVCVVNLEQKTCQHYIDGVPMASGWFGTVPDFNSISPDAIGITQYDGTCSMLRIYNGLLTDVEAIMLFNQGRSLDTVLGKEWRGDELPTLTARTKGSSNDNYTVVGEGDTASAIAHKATTVYIDWSITPVIYNADTIARWEVEFEQSLPANINPRAYCKVNGVTAYTAMSVSEDRTIATLIAIIPGASKMIQLSFVGCQQGDTFNITSTNLASVNLCYEYKPIGITQKKWYNTANGKADIMLNDAKFSEKPPFQQYQYILSTATKPIPKAAGQFLMTTDTGDVYICKAKKNTEAYKVTHWGIPINK